MEIKEAIAILARIQEPEAWETQITREAWQALEMAKEALVKESQGLAKDSVKDLPDISVGKCSEIPNSSETIYRQAAIDALRTCYDTETVTMDNGDEYINYDDAVGEIEQLPSAQPEKAQLSEEDATKDTTYDCISRRAAIDMCRKPHMRNADCSDFEMEIMMLPPAQPEPQWIPCSERLPDEKDAGILKKLGTDKRSEYVLATVEVKGERMVVTACTYDGVWHWDKKYAFPDFKVVAWIPKPEPYKGDEYD